jgi:hypothetical protein
MKKRMTLNPSVFEETNFTWNESVKYLVVDFDQKLSFKTHIENSISKSKKAISTLYCLLKKNSPASLQSKVTIFKSYIRPFSLTQFSFFFNCPKTNFKRLQIMQNKCLSMVLGALYYTRTTYLHHNAKVPYIRSYIYTLTKNFYRKAESHKNNMVNSLGKHTMEPPGSWVKHSMTRAICDFALVVI